MSSYKANVWSEVRPLMPATSNRVLDFGSGDGWYAKRVIDEGFAKELVAVDVKRREHTYVEPLLYEGERLPFPDGHFDLVYAIDVLHHCPDPETMLKEMLRVASRHFVIKDHTYRNTIGKFALAVMDEIGNRRFGIPSPQNYQREWKWDGVFHQSGWKKQSIIYPARCHHGLLGVLTNHLQYVAHYERLE
jgi:SAM-dependent methyltransferase